MWWRTDEEGGVEGGRESDQGCVWPGGDPHLHLPTNQCLRPSILLTHNHTACSASPAPSSHPSIPDIYPSIPSHILHANHLLHVLPYSLTLHIKYLTIQTPSYSSLSPNTSPHLLIHSFSRVSIFHFPFPPNHVHCSPFRTIILNIRKAKETV